MAKPVPRFWTWAGVGLLLVALLAFALLTPAPLLRKLDYIGAAVCHRLPGHSFFVAGRQLPICQRCTGTFTGALTGLLFQWLVLRRRRAQRFPSWPILAALAGLSAPWGLDGFNSWMTLQSGRAVGVLGYAPQPWLRLLTGTLMGMSMSVVLVAAFNQTFWRDGVSEPNLRGWRDFAALLAVELAQAGLILWQPSWMLYPLALYSAAGVVTMFVLLGSMVWVMALARDQRYTSWRQLALPFVWGGVFAALIIGSMNGVRLFLTGTIDGVPGL